MPAGRRNACETCYWKATFKKRLNIDKEGLSSQLFSSYFESFGMWLIDRVPPQKAALSIHRYYLFFLELEKQWPDVPTYSELVKYFTPEGLRRVRLPMEWFTTMHQVTVLTKEREETSELLRIATIMSSVPAGSFASTALSAYRDELKTKAEAGKTSIRSLRLALRPAASLLLSANSPDALPDQRSLDLYLRDTPGQRAGITGFVSFLNRRFEAALVVPPVDARRARGLRQKALENELSSMLARGERGAEFEVRWISVSLQYFHGLRSSISKALNRVPISRDERGFTAELKGAMYWVPHWDYRPSKNDQD